MGNESGSEKGENPPRPDIGSESNESGTWAIVGGSIAFFVLVVALFWGLGLFDKPVDEGSAKVLVAVLALVGVLFTETVAVLGLLLKQSIDDRAANLKAQELRQSELDADRIHVLRVSEEERAKVDVSIRAVGLIGGKDGELANSHQVGGAILALMSLGVTELAVTLVVELWGSDDLGPGTTGVSTTVASYVLERALAEGSDRAGQELAADALREHADMIYDKRTGTDHWPLPDHTSWPAYLERGARISVVLAACTWLSTEVAAGHENIGAFISLYGAMDDEDQYVSCAAARALAAVRPWIEHSATLGNADNGWHTEDRFVTFREAVERAEQEANDPFCDSSDPDIVTAISRIRRAVEMPAANS